MMRLPSAANLAPEASQRTSSFSQLSRPSMPSGSFSDASSLSLSRSQLSFTEGRGGTSSALEDVIPVSRCFRSFVGAQQSWVESYRSALSSSDAPHKRHLRLAARLATDSLKVAQVLDNPTAALETQVAGHLVSHFDQVASKSKVQGANKVSTLPNTEPTSESATLSVVLGSASSYQKPPALSPAHSGPGKSLASFPEQARLFCAQTAARAARMKVMSMTLACIMSTTASAAATYIDLPGPSTHQAEPSSTTVVQEASPAQMRLFEAGIEASSLSAPDMTVLGGESGLAGSSSSLGASAFAHMAWIHHDEQASHSGSEAVGIVLPSTLAVASNGGDVLCKAIDHASENSSSTVRRFSTLSIRRSESLQD